MRGRRTRPRVTLRTCVACRRRAAPEALVRLVAADDRILVSRTAPGRGAWLCPERACVDRARKSRAVSRALRRPDQDGLEALDAVLEGGNDARQGVRG